MGVKKEVRETIIVFNEAECEARRLLYAKMFFRDPIKSSGDCEKVLIQVQCADADLVSPPMIDMIRLHLLVRLRV